MHQMIGKTNILTIQSMEIRNFTFKFCKRKKKCQTNKSLKNDSTVSSTDLKISVDIYAFPHHSTENRSGKADRLHSSAIKGCLSVALLRSLKLLLSK